MANRRKHVSRHDETASARPRARMPAHRDPSGRNAVYNPLRTPPPVPRKSDRRDERPPPRQERESVDASEVSLLDTAIPQGEPDKVARSPRKAAAKERPTKRSVKVVAHRGAAHEAVAVLLGACGVVMVLALASFDPADVSLNASGAPLVSNWVGPAGAYLADFLLQGLGIGAYGLAAAMILAATRAFAGRRVLPGLREALGGVMFIVSVGALAHVLLQNVDRPYPAGGFLGALFGQLLFEKFAMAGSIILGGALTLVSLTFAADGILAGLGLHGLGAIKRLVLLARAAYIVQREKHRVYQARRAEQAASETPRAKRWDLGALPDASAEKERRDKKLEAARERGRRQGEAAAMREDFAARSRAVRDMSGPQVVLDQPVDLAEEEPVELGVLPEPEATPQPKIALAMPPPPREEILELDGDDVDIDVPIRAATPEMRRPKLPAPAGTDEGDEGDGQGTMPSRASAKTGVADVAASAADAWNRGSAAKVTPRAAPVAELAPAAAKPAPVSKPAPIETPAAALAPAADITSPEMAPLTGEPQIVDVRPDTDPDAVARAAAEAEEEAKQQGPVEQRAYELPSTNLLDFEAVERAQVDPERLRDNAQRLTKTLKDYGIEGHVREIRPGPVITMYEFVPAPGIKISKIASLADDLAMSMEAMRVRIVAPIPGKGAVGIEIPNDSTETVYLKELITHESFRKGKSKLPMALGKDIEGRAYVADLPKMPHLLVAGATGAGKSVSVNAMIMSVLFKATPNDVRFVMIDPKMLELSVYEGIPHLLLPVVTDPKKASLALRWAVEEMERRYKRLSALGVRNIDGYNAKIAAAQEKGEPLEITIHDKLNREEKVTCERLPYIIVIVDELADLMMVASREVEASIMRLAQMARAAGIHLILATQRPSVDVITGVIKANFPTRIAFQVASKHDSRTILDANGAEHLLGRGDMLYMSPGAGGISRVHGAYVSEAEIERTVAYWKEQGTPQYDESILAPRADEGEGAEGQSEEEKDEMYDQAVAIVLETRQASISMIQRRLRIGYNRAARLVERMEVEGLVGQADGAKPREILVPGNG